MRPELRNCKARGKFRFFDEKSWTFCGKSNLSPNRRKLIPRKLKTFRKNAPRRQKQKPKATPIEELLNSPNGKISNPLRFQKFSRITRGNSEPYVKPFPLTDDVSIQDGNPDRGKERLLHAKADSVALRLALTGLVQSRSATGRWISNRGRKPCYRQLARLVTGETKAFERTVEKTDQPTRCSHPFGCERLHGNQS